jgi:glycerate-2-kinase
MLPNLDLLQSAQKIYQAALKAVEPEKLIRESISLNSQKLKVMDRIFDLNAFEKIYLIAIGKAAPFMAAGLLNVIGNKIKGGIFLYLPGTKISLKKIAAYPASHPLPDERSLKAAVSILDIAKKANKKDLLFVLISGGGSAQICLPSGDISLEEKSIVTDKLIKAGADIKSLNIVRKHISDIKGGRLAAAAYPATIISLIISDVIHNDLSTIASGPTYWDYSTYKDACQVLKKHHLWNSTPDSVVRVIEKGIHGQIKETRRKEDEIFSRVFNFIIGDNNKALSAARKTAINFGYETEIITSSDQGEARETAKKYASLLHNIRPRRLFIPQTTCLLAGGELTVTVKGTGKGGRNQEFILAVLKEMSQNKQNYEWLILSLGTDGIDGPTDAAGAWITPLTADRAQKLSLEYNTFLKNNDAYNFFRQTGGLIFTGPTHTNVMDIRIFLQRF